ncbi:hypothetical protein QN224_13360 [Sinorhizobium sp. 8-89]|uniref:hypothetical protein n=1 Tax=Sinorhizobium sp. 7-81 TaxID=3049087 RepID=UPI0024C362E0|nr:hypothetical protein [Sinorhizobium sp. 7-81]MDK1386398.1 hypothetical protein [Sinorhizobium sp. 7-81]
MERALNAAAIRIPLMEIDDDLRGMLLSDKTRASAVISVHLFLRVGRHYQFRRGGEKVEMDEVVGKIVDAIWRVPETTLAEFGGQATRPRAAATDVIAREVFLGLSGAFEAVYVRKPNGGG